MKIIIETTDCNYGERIVITSEILKGKTGTILKMQKNNPKVGDYCIKLDCGYTSWFKRSDFDLVRYYKKSENNYCFNCGTELNNKNKYCHNCGSKIE